MRACEAGSLAEAAQVQITLDEWDRLRERRLVKTGHATDGSSESERNERFVVVGDQRLVARLEAALLQSQTSRQPPLREEYAGVSAVRDAEVHASASPNSRSSHSGQ